MPGSNSPTQSPPNDTAPFAIEDAINPFVKLGVSYWKSMRGSRRFPAREDLTLRGMAAILPYVVIMDVLENGADFEVRYVGDAQRQAFGVYFKGMRLTQIEASVPEFGSVLRAVYEQARAHGKPFIMRGQVHDGLSDTKFPFHETAFLPLGASDSTVDHLLIVGVQVPKPFWEIPASKLKDMTDKLRA